MEPLFLAIEIFYEQLHKGEFDLCEYQLAAALQKLADLGWNRVDRLLDEPATDLQVSIRID